MFKNNEVYIIKNGVKIRVFDENELSGIKINISGKNNIVVLGENCKFRSCGLLIEVDSSHVTIGNNTVMHNIFISMNSGYEQRLEIMDNNTFWGGKIVLRDTTHLKICKESIFAAGLSMWTCDAHTIFDLDTKQVLNENPEILEIGEHCWIGADTHILKKGSIARDTVVAMNSVVTKPFTEPNTIVGGYPAKVLRRNIGWSRDTIWNYKKKFLNEKKEK